jgi:ribosome-binding factor A
MNEIRKKRLETQIQRELSELIHRRRVRDDRLGFVSIVGVDITDDLEQAVIRISCFGTDDENKQTWRALIAAAGEFQSAVGKNLRLRQTPRFFYKEDTSIKEGDRILSLMKDDE